MSADDVRPGLLDILSQDERWWPATGPSLLLTDMGPRHKRNTLAFLRRNAGDYALIIAGAALNSMSENAALDVMSDLAAGPEDEWPWIEDMPLVERLRDLVAADEAADTPDEPDARIGQPLPCARICDRCEPITEPGQPWPCDWCPICSDAVAAAEEATWD